MKSHYAVIVAVLTLLTLLLVVIGCAPKPAAPTSAPSAPVAPATPTPTVPTAPTPSASAPGVEEGKAPAESGSAEEVTPPAEPTLGQGADLTEQKIETKTETGLAHDLSTSSDVFSEVGCADGRVTVKFTNTGDQTWYVTHKGVSKKKDPVNVALRVGVTDLEPGCDTYEVEPGQIAVCSEVDQGVVSGENRVQVVSPAGTFAKIVECP